MVFLIDSLIESLQCANKLLFLPVRLSADVANSLSDNPDDDDAKEAVEELLRGSIETDNVEDIITQFFNAFTLNDNNDHNDDANGEGKNDNNDQNDDGITPMKLTKAITMKEHDIKSFASGLSAEPMFDHEDENNNVVGGGPGGSSIRAFYANMIDISQNEAAISERKRRKERQKAIREALEDAERQRALQEAMDILNDDTFAMEQGEDGESPEDMLNAANDNSADVHLKNFDLPNLRGGGPDLLQNASLTLAKGRRYGLMGRNGCGKVSSKDVVYTYCSTIFKIITNVQLLITQNKRIKKKRVFLDYIHDIPCTKTTRIRHP